MSINKFCAEYSEFKKNWKDYTFEEKMELLDQFQDQLNEATVYVV